MNYRISPAKRYDLKNQLEDWYEESGELDSLVRLIEEFVEKEVKEMPHEKA